MDIKNTYPIGTPGKAWGDAERSQWLARQTIKRSYAEEVLRKLETISRRFSVEQYGSLLHAPERYPLFIARSPGWNPDKPVALITGGVHGYETSGVQGAIRFLETEAEIQTAAFNLLVAPCVSPWGYETINRWNPAAVDPNRSFLDGGTSEEATELMNYLDSLSSEIAVHIDLHETTDTDNTEFRPALAARDAKPQDNWNIPDGFYLVGDSERPATEFQQAIIESVEKTTHIAPADENGLIIGVALEQRGVINYPARKLGLCMGVTNASYVTTTEVYPDSPQVDPENCIDAQVAALVGGLDFAGQALR